MTIARKLLEKHLYNPRLPGFFLYLFITNQWAKWNIKYGMNLVILNRSGHLFLYIQMCYMDGSLHNITKITFQGKVRSFFPKCIFTKIKHILMTLSSQDESNPLQSFLYIFYILKIVWWSMFQTPFRASKMK